MTDTKQIERADAPEQFWKIINGLEAEGMKYLGYVSARRTSEQWAQCDLWEESARKRNFTLTEVHYGDTVFVFESAKTSFSSPRVSRAYVRTPKEAVA
jgi:hypothetical protein